MILYGASGHAKVIIEILEAIGEKIDFIVDDNPNLSELLGYKVFRNTGEYESAIVSIGSCQIRKKVVEQLKVSHWAKAIHPSAVISSRACVAEGSVVMANAVVNSCAQIGKHCIVNTGATIDHDCVIGDYVHVAPGAHISGGVTVGECTWIGVGTCVKQGVKIGKGCMIGAGSVVVKDIPDGVVAFGSPCKVVRENQTI